MNAGAALDRLKAFDFAGAAAGLGPGRPGLGLFADPLQDIRYREPADAGLAESLGRAARLSARARATRGCASSSRRCASRAATTDAGSRACPPREGLRFRGTGLCSGSSARGPCGGSSAATRTSSPRPRPRSTRPCASSPIPRRRCSGARTTTRTSAAT
ncbi:MAG: hypothetical protein M0D55_08760 [Elusimicrobiota bacterium]|nr:MAG: hypothetical protein M0D55_08760 [Elusimicrobiota bacterium]